MTTNAVSVTHGSWMRMTASPARQATRNSCPLQMMARPLTSKRGNRRKDKNRNVNTVRRALSQINILSMTKTAMTTMRDTDKMNRMKVGDLFRPISHTCKKVIVTMIRSRGLVMMNRRTEIDQNKTHR